MGELAHKVRELDPGSRALLDLSVRRGLGDVEIAGVLGTDPNYVASTRTGVMQSIAADLQIGEAERTELEELLAQLPPEAWLPPAEPEPVANGSGNGTAHAAVAPVVEPEGDVEAEAAEVEPETAEPEAEVAEADAVEPEAEVVEEEGTEEVEPEAEAVEPEAVEAEVAEEEGTEEVEPEAEAGDDTAPETDDAGRDDRPGTAVLTGPARKRRRTGAIVTTLALVLVGVVLIVLLASNGDDGSDSADEPAAPAEREEAGRGGGAGGDQDEPAGGPSRGGRERPPGQALEALPAAGEARGTARLEGERLELRLSGLPQAAGTYEVWLYDSLIDAQSLGRLRARSGGRLRGSFPAGDIGRFANVDISLEPRDGNANHSGRSVMRIATSDLR